MLFGNDDMPAYEAHLLYDNEIEICLKYTII